MAVRLALAEKGLAHRFIERGLATIADLRPEDLMEQFAASMPTLIHEGVALYDLDSILRYVDEAFPGPPLQPPTPAGRAVMTQLLGIMRDHLHPCAIGAIVAPRVFAPMLGQTPEAGDLAAAEARLVEILALISDISDSWVARPGREWLLGPAPGLADLQLAPVVNLIQRTAEGRRAMAGLDQLTVWWARIQQRSWLEAVLHSGEI